MDTELDTSPTASADADDEAMIDDAVGRRPAADATAQEGNLGSPGDAFDVASQRHDCLDGTIGPEGTLERHDTWRYRLALLPMGSKELDFTREVHGQVLTLANPWSHTVSADLTLWASPEEAVLVAAVELAPGQAEEVELPHPLALDEPDRRSLEVTTTAPISATTLYRRGHPYAPNSRVATSSLSLLHQGQLGHEYVVSSYFTWLDFGLEAPPEQFGYLVVVAGASGACLRVQPRAELWEHHGAPTSLEAYEAHHLNLAPHEARHFRALHPGEDITGTSVVADRPISVFAGHLSVAVAGACCLESLQATMAPVSRWTNEYVAPRSPRRGLAPDVWRIVAATDDTHVTIGPGERAPVLLKRGNFFEVIDDRPLHVTATHPVGVFQYASGAALVHGEWQVPCGSSDDCLTGFVCESGLCSRPPCSIIDGVESACPDGQRCMWWFDGAGRCKPVGDPVLVQLLSPSDHASRYTAFAHASDIQRALVVVAPEGTMASLDGVDAGEVAGTVGDSGLGQLELPIEPGIHEVQLSKPGAVYVYGLGHTRGHAHRATAVEGL